MIGLKEIVRRWKSQKVDDVQWVVNFNMITMAILGLICLAFILVLS